eukprot:292059-Hanusia_phi.AAC.1
MSSYPGKYQRRTRAAVGRINKGLHIQEAPRPSVKLPLFREARWRWNQPISDSSEVTVGPERDITAYSFISSGRE